MADQIRPTPRSPILGLFSDLVNLPLQYMSAPQRTQQMQGVAEFIRSTGVPYALESLSYDPSGRGLFTGAGGLGGTTRLRPEAAEAALTVAPMVGPAARVAGRGAMAVGRAGERYAERVVPQIMERGGLPAEMVSAMGQGTQSPLTVYHGSPYRFDRFDPTKIGSGEGAQAYGYGHYVAQSPGVAKSYQEALSGYSADGKRLPRNIGTVVSNFGGDVNAAIADRERQLTNWLATNPDKKNFVVKDLQDEIKKLKDLKGKSLESTGSLYTIDLPDEQIARMLDYDKPLSQQPDIVKRINPQSLGLTYKQLENGNHAFVNSEGKIIGNLQKGGTQESFTKNWTEDVLRGTGSDLYRQLGQGMEGGPKVSSALRQAGIPGIRYLDEGSRGTGQGTSNFVVFPGNEDLLRILEVNGEELLNPIMYRDPFGSTVR